LAFKFFKDKSKGPQEVTCPLCQNVQQESPLAVSSYCKRCKAYLSFRKGGEIIARAQATPDPFAHRPAQPKVEIDYKPREERAKTPSPPRKPAPEKPAEPQEEEEAESRETRPETAEPEAPAAPEPTQEVEVITSPDKTSLEAVEAEPVEEEPAPRFHSEVGEENSNGSLKKKLENERLAICFECGDSHIANSLANSTQCRKCGRLISLQDQHIKEAWSSRIQTRGSVYIHKKGIVIGASIQCHNLIVEGDFTGSAECTGDLTLRRHGKILGKVICDRLLVEKRAKVEFLNTVEMNECRIDGLVTGNLVCKGRLALEKKATLTGNVKVGALTVADGARHTGQIQMGQF
jgi:cytoskeletal protein CcmA (bactofilin family)